MILLSGPPGTGKTSSVRAFVSSLPPNAKMMAYSRGNFVHEYYISAQIADKFPGLAFVGVVDDIDMIAVDRNHGGGRLGMFIDMDSTAYHPPNMVVLATTNRPEVLDSAMLRPGRTRKILTFDIPTSDDRKEIIGIYARKAGIDVDIDGVARKTDKFTGDDIRAVFSEIRISKRDPQGAMERAIEDVALHKGFVKKRKSAKKDDDLQDQHDVA
jgi:transitional endoplasmic reticulum ATPase